MSFESVLPGLVSSLATVYTTKKAYDAQRDASELQSEAAQEQVRTAGLQEAAAAQQEVAAVESARLAELNAIDAELQSAREVENLRQAQRAEQATSRARAAASGVTLTGSTADYLQEQQRVGSEQLGWLAKSGASKVDQIRQQGQIAQAQGMEKAAQTRAGAQATRAQAAGTKASAYGTKAGAYQSLGQGAYNLFNIGQTMKWF